MTEVEKAAEAYTEKERLEDMASYKSFLAGAAWQREQDAKIAEGEILIEVMEPEHTHKQTGAAVANEIARLIRAQTSDVAADDTSEKPVAEIEK